ncbi:uncharacterized protein BDV17DRAFT_291423 [Aspergillus undulatus]|uniref:uncharacterized protein n=1 Tax=Aspergillus undulatus TaxID=1810928 RepID=UPI003CCD668D
MDTDVAWDFSWKNNADDNLFHELARSAREELDDYAEAMGAYNEYVCLNYADRTQNPLWGYGPDNLAFLKRVSEEYDPEGVFQELVPGGFKIWEA